MPKTYLLYHFMHPDDVISALLFSDLASELVGEGWDVTALPCNRSYWDSEKAYSALEEWNGVRIERLWRPAFQQSGGLGRILNAAWMIGRWSLLALNPRHRPDVLIVGSDPMLCVLAVIAWRCFKPKTKIVHWCFDLYPEAAYADEILSGAGLIAGALAWLMRRAYRHCDLVVDIGPRMREMLELYGPVRQRDTIVPWAQVEPVAVVNPSATDKRDVFGSESLTLLYSGSFGRAHSFEGMLGLVRRLRRDGVSLALSVRGNREQELRAAIREEDTNINFLAYASLEELEKRLALADIHVITLRDEWTGTVVPSKFFGALAIGRPVLFCGRHDADIAQWIERFGLGWVLAPGDTEKIAAAILAAMMDADEMQALRQRCFTVYQEQFSRGRGVARWSERLRETLGS